MVTKESAGDLRFDHADKDKAIFDVVNITCGTETGDTDNPVTVMFVPRTLHGQISEVRRKIFRRCSGDKLSRHSGEIGITVRATSVLKQLMEKGFVSRR